MPNLVLNGGFNSSVSRLGHIHVEKNDGFRPNFIKWAGMFKILGENAEQNALA